MKLDSLGSDRIYENILTLGMLIMTITSMTAVTLWMGKQILICIFNMDI